MALNPNIILGFQPPQIDTPLDSMGKLMKFREAASQEALRAAQVQHYQSLAKQAQFEEEQKRAEISDQETLKQIQGDPDSYSKIMGGDFTPLHGKVRPDTLAKVQKQVDDFHHTQSVRAEDDLKAHNAGLGQLVQAAEGLKELGDIDEINAQLPNVIDNLSRAGAFKAAQVDPTKVPQRVNDVKELDSWLASVGGLMAANDAGLKRKGAKLATQVQESQIEANKALAMQRETPKISKESLALEAAGGDAGEALKLLSTEKAPGQETAEYRNYQHALEGGFKGSFMDFEKTKANLHTTATTSATEDDVKDTARAIIEGHANPTLSNYSFRDRTKLAAQLQRAGYDQATAERDWKAVQRHLSTLNGAQQERLRQAITFTYDSLDVIDDLYKEWQKLAPVSGFKILNKATLAASKNAPGRTGAVANSLEAQINDLTSELGTVYKGGNSSTDESLRLAAQNLRADWNPETFNKAMQQIRKNLQIRKNSILTSEPAGVSKGSPYVTQQPETPPSGGIAQPKTKAEYDALPSGTIYMKDGHQFRKK